MARADWQDDHHAQSTVHRLASNPDVVDREMRVKKKKPLARSLVILRTLNNLESGPGGEGVTGGRGRGQEEERGGRRARDGDDDLQVKPEPSGQKAGWQAGARTNYEDRGQGQGVGIEGTGAREGKLGRDERNREQRIIRQGRSEEEGRGGKGRYK